MTNQTENYWTKNQNSVLNFNPSTKKYEFDYLPIHINTDGSAIVCNKYGEKYEWTLFNKDGYKHFTSLTDALQHHKNG